VANLTQTSAPSVSGIQGFEFPVQNTANNTTVAEQSPSNSSQSTASPTGVTPVNTVGNQLPTTNTVPPPPPPTIQSIQQTISRLEREEDTLISTPPETIDGLKRVWNNISLGYSNLYRDLRSIATTSSQQTATFNALKTLEKADRFFSQLDISVTNPNFTSNYLDLLEEIVKAETTVKVLFSSTGLVFRD
jgi:hypothetical protein